MRKKMMVFILCLLPSFAFGQFDMKMDMNMGSNMDMDMGTDMNAGMNNSMKTEPKKAEPKKAEVRMKSNVKGDIDLRYRFKKGQRFRYQSTEQTEIKMKMGNMPGMNMQGMGMGNMNMGGMTVKFLAETNFTLKILSVLADGSANFETVINSFYVYAMPSKTLVASHAGMKGLKVKGHISTKGKVTFYEDLVIIKTEAGETLLARASVSKNKMSGTAQAGDTRLDVEASYNPKTGTLTASTRITKVKKPKVKKVVVKKKDNKIDILPKKVMELFLLPEEKIAYGHVFEFKAPMMKVDFTANKAKKANTIKMDSHFQSDVSDNQMAQMGSMKTDAKVKAEFNLKKGFLDQIHGTIDTGMKAVGMDMNVHSVIHMKKQR